jgi:hypothetical protein
VRTFIVADSYDAGAKCAEERKLLSKDCVIATTCGQLIGLQINEHDIIVRVNVPGFHIQSGERLDAACLGLEARRPDPTLDLT